jgi:hypothetical protein
LDWQRATVSRHVVQSLDLGAINETARHLGHLDLLREQLDGTRSY